MLFRSAGGQNKGGRVWLHGKIIAQWPPGHDFVAGSQGRHALGAGARGFDEADKMPGRHVANTEWTPPGQLKPKGFRSQHHKLSRMPFIPAWMGKAHGKKMFFAADRPKSHHIQHFKLRQDWLHSLMFINRLGSKVNLPWMGSPGASGACLVFGGKIAYHGATAKVEVQNAGNS